MPGNTESWEGGRVVIRTTQQPNEMEDGAPEKRQEGGAGNRGEEGQGARRGSPACVGRGPTDFALE